MLRKRLVAWLFKVVITLVVLLVLGGLGATVYELHRVSTALESLRSEGLRVNGSVSVDGSVDVDNAYGSTFDVDVDTVDVEVSNPFLDTFDISVRDTVDVRVDQESGYGYRDPIEVRAVR